MFGFFDTTTPEPIVKAAPEAAAEPSHLDVVGETVRSAFEGSDETSKMEAAVPAKPTPSNPTWNSMFFTDPEEEARVEAIARQKKREAEKAQREAEKARLEAEKARLEAERLKKAELARDQAERKRRDAERMKREEELKRRQEEQKLIMERQLAERDMLDSVFESFEGRVCPTTPEDVLESPMMAPHDPVEDGSSAEKPIDADEEARRILSTPKKGWTGQDRDILKSVVIHKVRDDYRKLGRRLEKLARYSDNGDNMSVMSAGTDGGSFKAYDTYVGLAKMSRYQKDVSNAEIRSALSKNANKMPSHVEPPVQEAPPKQEERSLSSVNNKDDKRNQEIEAESRAPPSPAHQPDFLDAAFETLEIGLCCAAATPATVQ